MPSRRNSAEVVKFMTVLASGVTTTQKPARVCQGGRGRGSAQLAEEPPAAGSDRLSTTRAACPREAIEAHSEDYSEPFGDHIGAYGLCRGCHVMIHRWFQNPADWAATRPESARPAAGGDILP
jgi:hypothetical protein